VGIDAIGWFLEETIAKIRLQMRTYYIVNTVTEVVLKSVRTCLQIWILGDA
jgi:hypothetical protein